MKRCLPVVSMAYPARMMNLVLFFPIFLLSPLAQALTTVNPGQTLNIDASTSPDNYLVNGGVLNTNAAQTFEVFVQSGATLNAVGGTFAGRNGNSGINAINGDITVDGATVTGSGAALSVVRQGPTTTGSTAVVGNSTITGGTSGALITGLSSLVLNGGTVTGTQASSTGIQFFGGDVRANGTTISGGENGARIAADGAGLGDTRLSLNGATLQGRAGSAILIEDAVEASIEVLNNSTLLAGNNLLLDVQGASTAAMTVNNSTLQGNINIAGNSTGNLTFDQGRMIGDVLVEDGSTANVTLNNGSQFTGRLDKVNGVTVNSGSLWTLTASDTVGTLAMNGGTVRFGAQNAPDTFYQLNVGTLAGSPDGSSTLEMKGNFATGQHDFLNVTGVASGQFGLLVAASGLDAVNPQELTLVHTAAGDAQFALRGGRVDLGAWSYDLAQRADGTGGTDWYLDPTTQTISPGARAVLALAGTPITVIMGEDASWRSRMGELRFNGGLAGAWIRTFGNQYNVAAGSGTAYQQNQRGFSLGADARVGESNVLVGLMGGFSESDLNLEHGTSGTVKSYSFGPYVTWMEPDSGYYADGVLKFNRFRNEAKVSLSDGTRTKGDYDNWGVSASAEFGRHIKLDNDYYVEPFAKVLLAQIQGNRFSLDNDMQADGDRARSLLGKVGATVGRNFELGDGAIAQPYLRAALAHEFANNNEVKVNNNTFNNDLSGSRMELGAGVAVAMSEKWQVHVDLDYSNGEHIEQPWGGNVGLRYAF